MAMIIIVFVSFSLGAAWMGRYGDRPARHYPRLMVGSLLPIVLGYVVAHYATLFIVEGQRTAINFSDPLGRGWNVFGSAEMGVNSAIFNHPTAIALIQLGAIVAGHVFGIVCAHEKAVALLPPDRAVRSVAVAAGDGRLHLRRTAAAVLPAGSVASRVSDQCGVLELRSGTLCQVSDQCGVSNSTGGLRAGGCAISPAPEDRHSELPHPEGALTWRFKTECSGSGVLGDLACQVSTWARYLVGEIRWVAITA